MRTAIFMANQGIEEWKKDLSAIATTSDGKPKLTLHQKLKLFDPAHHSGEVMAIKPIGVENIK